MIAKNVVSQSHPNSSNDDGAQRENERCKTGTESVSLPRWCSMLIGGANPSLESDKRRIFSFSGTKLHFFLHICKFICTIQEFFVSLPHDFELYLDSVRTFVSFGGADCVFWLRSDRGVFGHFE